MTKKDVKLVTGAIVIIMIAIIISLVYAGFTGQLNINGNAVNRQSKWDIHFENLSTITTTHTAKVLAQPRLASSTSIEDYSVSTTTPGDSISFTFDVVNEGNYNASITSVNIGTPTCTGTDSISNSNVCAHLHYSLTYDSGATVQTGDVLYAKETNKMKVTITYDDTVTASELATSDVTISNLDITINFEQDSDALVKDNGEVADYRVYKQGDKITLNNEDYYVITNSGVNEDYVVALKDTPLTVEEVNLYGGVGTENNHVNRYSNASQGTAGNSGTYGRIVYYSSETCGYVNGKKITTNCTSNYVESDIKYIVDSWSESKFINDELKEIDGYRARLIKLSELIELGYPNGSNYIDANENVPSWVYNNGYQYYTMSQIYGDNILRVLGSGRIDNIAVWEYTPVVRPVINVYKSAISQS